MRRTFILVAALVAALLTAGCLTPVVRVSAFNRTDVEQVIVIRISEVDGEVVFEETFQVPAGSSKGHSNVRLDVGPYQVDAWSGDVNASTVQRIGEATLGIDATLYNDTIQIGFSIH